VIRTPSILAVSEHTGWAYVLCVSARDRRPFVVTRRRIVLIDRGLPTQPYEHGTKGMAEDEAEALIANVRSSVARMTSLALGRLVDELSREHPVTALTIRRPPFEKLPARLADVHASYPLFCSADGLLYHFAIRNAARRLGLDVRLCLRGEEIDLAAAALELSPDSVEEFVTGSGRPSGPPWTVEHRHAYAAAIGALAPRVRGLTIAPPRGGARRSTKDPRARPSPPQSPTPPGHLPPRGGRRAPRRE
jgi:hypothetical protein